MRGTSVAEKPEPCACKNASMDLLRENLGGTATWSETIALLCEPVNQLNQTQKWTFI